MSELKTPADHPDSLLLIVKGKFGIDSIDNRAALLHEQVKFPLFRREISVAVVMTTHNYRLLGRSSSILKRSTRGRGRITSLLGALCSFI